MPGIDGLRGWGRGGGGGLWGRRGQKADIKSNDSKALFQLLHSDSKALFRLLHNDFILSSLGLICTAAAISNVHALQHRAEGQSHDK